MVLFSIDIVHPVYSITHVPSMPISHVTLEGRVKFKASPVHLWCNFKEPFKKFPIWKKKSWQPIYYPIIWTTPRTGRNPSQKRRLLPLVELCITEDRKRMNRKQRSASPKPRQRNGAPCDQNSRRICTFQAQSGIFRSLIFFKSLRWNTRFSVFASKWSQDSVSRQGLRGHWFCACMSITINSYHVRRMICTSFSCSINNGRMNCFRDCRFPSLCWRRRKCVANGAWNTIWVDCEWVRMGVNCLEKRSEMVFLLMWISEKI